MSTLAHECPVLLVADNPDEALAASLQQALRGLPELRLESTSFAAAPLLLGRREPALLFLHVTGPADAGPAAAVLRAAAAAAEPTSAVVIGEAGQAEHGLALLRQGAADYLERPLDVRRIGLLADVLTVRARQRQAARPAPAAKPVVEEAGTQGNFVYCPNAPLGRVMDQVRRVAGVDTNILIQGETGTGKTRLARVIHDLSPRKDKPFLVVNCAALSATLIESEMFGHVKGAFTGADRDRVGKFAEAGDGTLFLDEIDSLPAALQAKLLRVVEDRVFEQVGSNTPVQMRARVITASNKPLDREVEAGRFRSDLYFRLNVVSFEMPPLRDREQVFGAMVERFVEEFAGRAGRKIDGVTPAAMAALRAHRWPGNIRELRNVIERAVALRPEGKIDLDDLPDTIREVPAAAVNRTAEPAAPAGRVDLTDTPVQTRETSLRATRAGAEADHIVAVLTKNRNNRSKAATELGISRETLYKKLRRYGLFDAAR